jgi:uncharacterized protein with HEPN domain
MRTLRMLLDDIQEAIHVIEQYAPADLATFLADPSIPWRQIIAMRNVVIHVYHGINWERVYDTARSDIPVLKREITLVIGKLPPSA